MINKLPFNTVFLFIIFFGYFVSCSSVKRDEQTTTHHAYEDLGKHPLLGMHDTIGGDQSTGFETLESLTHAHLQIWSSDFGFSTHPNDSYKKRDDLLAKALYYDKLGVLVTLSYHQCNPLIGEPCPFEAGVAHRDLSAREWKELLSENSALNLRWKKQMDKIAHYFKILETNGVHVLFRPYHESNIPGFWWHSADASYSKALWMQLRRYFLEHHKLSNISWVWAVSYHPKYWKDVERYYPGDAFVDIVGVDIYPSSRNSAPDFETAWNALKKMTPLKPLALTEVSQLPSKNELRTHPWAYIIPWGKTMLFKENNVEAIKNFYGP